MALNLLRRHFLVRAEARCTRRGRRTATAFCVGAPLLVMILAVLVYGAGGTLAGWDEVQSWTSAAAFSFVCCWPLLMVMGAALSTSMAVLAERSGEIALQIVLTPVSGDAIAAAKILPRVRPFLWGVAAALPLYLWAGGSETLTFGGLGLNPLAFPLLRPLALLAPGGPTPTHSLGGWIGGIFMLLADAGTVWAAAHWGACYAVWLGNLTGTMLFLAWRFFYQSLTFSMWWLPFSTCLLASRSGDPALGALAVSFQGFALLALLWFFPWRGATQMTLEEFSRYDRLADDDFRPGYFKRFYLRRPIEAVPRWRR
jgi:hypothetical protein